MRKRIEGETVRMLRIPPAERATEEIPRYDEEGLVDDNWGRATGRIPDEPEEFHSRGFMTPSEIKDRNIALMTAACIWFGLLCVFGVVGSFVLKLIGAILGI
jgi:hypothetical protein